MIDPFLDADLATFGLDENRFGVIGRRASTTLRWPATGTGPDGAVLQFRMIAGLRHKYPDADNNPAGFEALPAFWRFFIQHQTRPHADGLLLD